ncbi:hypothetical protein [Allosphingosinicella sp.]|uniref:hypothetical protein n=1 Tax=Allosphingosinicella sp. TaxID=2823234 RepID=UPI002FC182BE
MATSASLPEAWFFAVLILAGLSVGSLGLSLLGRLLGRNWVTPMDDELRPAALLIPLVAVLALPLAFGGFHSWVDARPLSGVSPRLGEWFEEDLILLRSLGYFMLWSAIAWIMGQTERHRWSALGLMLLGPTVGLAGFDWVLAREPFWWSTLFGFAFAVSQLPAALALAFLANALQRERVGRLHDRSLTSALLTLALVTLWLWFTQYLTAFTGNLPAEAAWYEARMEGTRWIPLGVAAATLGGAILLLVQRHRGRWAVLGASALILVQHLLHIGWLLRPAGTPELGLLDLLALILLGGAWGLAWLLLMRRHDARAQSGRSGSS